MCTLAFAYRTWPGFDLVLVGNRDEFLNRPSAALAQWTDAPTLLAGRDLQAGGTWMGATRQGRFATLTNLREPDRLRPDAPSRGALVSAFLLNHQTSLEYLQAVANARVPYNGFNLLCFDGTTLAYYSNRNSAPIALEPGIYALSNATLGAAWPKVEALQTAFAAECASSTPPDVDRLSALLTDANPYPDHRLPHTGVPLDLERALSALCIRLPHYGTVAHSVVTLSPSRLHFSERSAHPATVGRSAEVSLPLAR